MERNRDYTKPRLGSLWSSWWAYIFLSSALQVYPAQRPNHTYFSFDDPRISIISSLNSRYMNSNLWMARRRGRMEERSKGVYSLRVVRLLSPIGLSSHLSLHCLDSFLSYHSRFGHPFSYFFPTWPSITYLAFLIQLHKICKPCNPYDPSCQFFV